MSLLIAPDGYEYGWGVWRINGALLEEIEPDELGEPIETARRLAPLFDKYGSEGYIYNPWLIKKAAPQDELGLGTRPFL